MTTLIYEFVLERLILVVELYYYHFQRVLFVQFATKNMFF